MDTANAALFKPVPSCVRVAVGGATWKGGLDAYGGFALSPIIGSIAG